MQYRRYDKRASILNSIWDGISTIVFGGMVVVFWLKQVSMQELSWSEYILFALVFLLLSLLTITSFMAFFFPLIYDKNTLIEMDQMSGTIHYVNDYTGDFKFKCSDIVCVTEYYKLRPYTASRYLRLKLTDNTEILISSCIDIEDLDRRMFPLVGKEANIDSHESVIFEHFPLHMVKYHNQGRWLRQQKKRGESAMRRQGC